MSKDFLRILLAFCPLVRRRYPVVSGPRQRWAHTRTAIAGAVFLTSIVSVAGNSISTTATDPGKTCSVLNENLPNNLHSIRQLGRLQKEEVGGHADICEHQAKDCSVHTMEFRGLSLSVLAKNETREVFPLGVTLSAPSWRLLGDIKVGQPLEFLEKHYGAMIPRDVAPVVLVGECTPLTVWHANGRVTQLALDCQACI
jgi:hypothetical protein